MLSHNKKASDAFTKGFVNHMEGYDCRYCPHDLYAHVGSSQQPHIYVVPNEKATRHYVRVNGEEHNAKKIILGRNVMLKRTYCRECAKEVGTRQVMCYQRTVGTGEVFDTRTNEIIQMGW